MDKNKLKSGCAGCLNEIKFVYFVFLEIDLRLLIRSAKSAFNVFLRPNTIRFLNPKVK